MINPIKIWLKEIRANFLVLAVALVMIGGAAAWHYSNFNPGIFIITLIGVVSAHISVNLFNEYSDWKTGIDENTERTPFSGGSGNLQKGLLKPFQVRLAAWITLTVAFFIGLGLACVSGWQVLIFMGIGGITIVFYTEYLTKWMIGEFASGLTLGSFVVIGTYFVQTSEITSNIIWASVSPGILTMLLLLLNEFPDIEADRTGGRRHLVIVLGERISGVIYSILLMCVYLVFILGAVKGTMPVTVLLCFITFPLAAHTVYRVLRYGSEKQGMNPALGMNVIVVLTTDFLLAVSYLIR
ncbi:1,4-dihydroxy-2-naphthoate octaprenyltransferase [Candidatus Latescibacterota bacterium]